MLQLFDTARGGVFPLELRTPGEVSMYVCGPTVYGPPHLGHGRFSLVFDVLRRYLEWRGLRVRYVSNITDIDDKIIARAVEEGRPASEVAAECETVWWEAMDALGVKRPTEAPHATAYVDQMVELIGGLLADGAAYETDDGLYFSAEQVADYGLLARQSLDSLRAGARVEAKEGKRAPIDFALWKKAKPGEPSWPSPWGPGRPGWHTECVVMSLDLLGDGFDLHGGGQDLAFPHHENERAQAVASGHTFARHWAHNGFIEVEGAKMSKSLGNFTTLGELIDAVDPRAYRLLVLRSHYRSPIEVNAASTADASAALERLDAFARRTASLTGAREEAAAGAGSNAGRAADVGAEEGAVAAGGSAGSGAGAGTEAGAVADGDADPEAGAVADGDADPDVLAQFVAAMDDDLDTPAATALLFDTVKRANTLLDAADEAAAAPLAAAVAAMCEAVGLQLHASADVPADVLARAAERDAARASRDYAAADAIRAELQAAGWTVEDTPGGTVVRR